MIYFVKCAIVAFFCAFLGNKIACADEKSAYFTHALQTTDAMRTETKFLKNALEGIHYARRPIEEIDMKEFIDQYIEQFDAPHLFFLQPELDALHERFSSALPFYIQQGNLYPAFDIFVQFKTKLTDRFDWIEARLEEPFDFSSAGEFVPDRRKLPWPKNLNESNILWGERLQFELINEILLTESSRLSVWEHTRCTARYPIYVLRNPFITLNLYLKAYNENQFFENLPLFCLPKPQLNSTQVDKGILWVHDFKEAKKSILTRYKRLKSNLLEFDGEDVQEVFLSTFARQYDPHSSFLSSDSIEELSISIHNSLVGIGAVLAEDEGYCIIRELIPGGPAAKSKQLKPGDAIVGIAQGNGPMMDVIGLNLRKTVRLIRGTKGTTVRLLIRPAEGDQTTRKIVPLVRDEVELTTSLAKAQLFTLPGPDRSYKIGVIEIPAFYGADVQGNVQTSTTKDVQELIEKLKSKGVEGIILDIRYNGGGLLDEAVSLTGLFVKTAPVLQVKDSFGQLSEFIDQNDFIAWNGPLIVFVSRYSASASEILAGALKDQNRALLVGDPTTHGKGTVQAILEVDRSFFHRFKKIKMGAVKITIQKWYRPSGESTQLKGVPSDIVLPSINPFLQIGESDLPQALAWDQIHALPWIEPDDYGLTNSLKASLKTKSAHRHNTLPELQLLQKSVDWLAEKQQQKSFSLNLEKRRQERQATILYQQALETELESLGARTPYPSEKILLDAALAIENEKYTNPNTVSNLLNEDDALDHNSQASSTDLHLHEALRIMSDWIGYY